MCTDANAFLVCSKLLRQEKEKEERGTKKKSKLTMTSRGQENYVGIIRGMGGI